MLRSYPRYQILMGNKFDEKKRGKERRRRKKRREEKRGEEGRSEEKRRKEKRRKEKKGVISEWYSGKSTEYLYLRNHSNPTYF